MENLIVCIALYVLIIAVAYCPNKTTATVDPAVPIDYFPEEEETTEPTPFVIPAQQAIATATAKQPKPKATLSTLIKEEVSKPAITATTPAEPAQGFTPDLSTLPIRALYARAKGKVKGYKNLSKAQLIQALA